MEEENNLITGSNKMETFQSQIKALYKSFVLPILCGILLLTSTANSIYFKKMTNAIPNYPFFLMQFSNFVYIPLCYGVVWYQDRLGQIDEQTKTFPKYKFAIIAIFDALSNILGLFGGVYTKGTTQMLIVQASIPVTMFFSYLYLKTKYEWMQYIGASVIMSGVFVVLSPKLVGHHTQDLDKSKDILFFNILFFAANIPGALSNIYKEGAFKGAENLNVWYTMGYVALYGQFLGFLFLPFNSLKILGDQYIPFTELPSAFWDGFKCLCGVDSIIDHCFKDDPIPGLIECDHCEGAWKVIVIYLAFNIIFNVIILMVLQIGSAAMLVVIMTLRLPLGNMAFYMPAIMGDDAQPFNPHDLSGLIVILIGVVIYRYQRSPDSEESDAPYVLTTVLTMQAGVREPITTEVQRKPITMKRSASHIRGNLYARLGVPPSNNYYEPEDVEATPGIPVDNSSCYGSFENHRIAAGSYIDERNKAIKSSMGVSVGKEFRVSASPVVRASPLLDHLMQSKNKKNSKVASSVDDDDEKYDKYKKYDNNDNDSSSEDEEIQWSKESKTNQR